MDRKEIKHSLVDRLVNILVKQGTIASKQAAEYVQAFAKSGVEQFEKFLLDEGLIEKKALLNALSGYYQLPAFDVVGHFFDNLLVTDFPKDFLLRHAVIPLELDGDELVVVAADPSVDGLEHALRKFSDNDIIFMVGLRPDICDAIKEFYDKPLTEEIPEDSDLKEEQRLAREEKEYENLDEIDNPRLR